MSFRTFNLYIDESGTFDDDVSKLEFPTEASLVGGVLCEPSVLSTARIEKLLPHKVHCCEKYNKYYIDVLEQLFADGARFVIFENKERLKVVNGDTTYLNIISEGLVQLLNNIKIDYPNDSVKVNIVVATRKAMNASTGIISPKEYRDRLEEKLYLAVRRNKAQICSYTISFEDARTYKRLEFADVVCNTYLTRNRKSKFNEIERGRIEMVYDKRYVYSVFEDATIGYMKRLFVQRRYGELMYQICTLTKLAGVKELRNKLLERIEKTTEAEQNTYFTYMSLQIGQYNNQRMYNEGILFAENYKKYIIDPCCEIAGLKMVAQYWKFDTDFYLLTMYDHIGYASKCEEYFAKCSDNIESINHSWEHIDYYFLFRIRELNSLMGRFDFISVIEKSNKLVNILKNAKELFTLIETYDGSEKELRSELLGKVYGVQLQAYTNMILFDPTYYSKAVDASEKALSEFEKTTDIHRQYQYRSSLLINANKPVEALDYLLGSYDLSIGEKDVFSKIINLVYEMNNNPDYFAIWHYTNIMIALSKCSDSKGPAMYKALLSNQSFVADLRNEEKHGYPWNMVLWNISRWYRMTGAISAADSYYNRALRITKEHTEQVTMFSFSISMVADYLLWCLEKGKMSKHSATTSLEKTLNSFYIMELPDSMKQHYEKCIHSDIVKTLRQISIAYLK